jgi:tRNA dimethylallyltransferase
LGPSPLLFLVGPTAVGKTALALEVAERLGAVILSADAYCVYAGMDLGTAKPTAAERSRVPHRGIDLVPVTAPFSIERYRDEAVACLEEARAGGRPVVVAGGSGFYLRSFFAPVMDTVEIPDAVRARVAALEAEAGLAGLQAVLRPLLGGRGPDETPDLDWRNPRRVSRALERCLASGRSLAELQADFSAQAPPFADWPKRVCLLERGRAELHARIATRVEAMLAAGLVEEVRGLRAAGLERNPTAAAAIGYRETLAYLRGELPDLAALRESIVVHTRQLARKQGTWFRRQIPVDRCVAAASATPEEAFPEVFGGS